MCFGKRIDIPGGARKAVRDDVLTRAAMRTRTASRSVDLLDMSLTGARLQGDGLPQPGEDVLLIVGRLEAFGEVVWHHDDQCGVRFDVALGEDALATVERERGPSRLLDVGLDAVLASDDWQHGLAR